MERLYNGSISNRRHYIPAIFNRISNILRHNVVFSVYRLIQRKEAQIIGRGETPPYYLDNINSCSPNDSSGRESYYRAKHSV